MSRTRNGALSAKEKALGIGIVLLSALLIGLAPNAAKIAYQDGADPLAVIAFRTVIGAIGIAIYLTLRQQWPRRGQHAFRRSAISGFAQVLTALGFLGAVAFIDVSLAALIFYFHPFLIAAVGHFRGDMAMSPGRMLSIAGAIAGLALVFGVTFATLNVVGVALSLLGMVAITVLIFAVAGLSKAVGPIPANFYMTLWSTLYLLVIVIFGPLSGLLNEMSMPTTSRGWIAIVGAGVTTTIGYILFFVGAGMIGVTRAAIWTVTEPLFAIFLAILLVQEWLTPLQWLGVAVVIGSLFKFETAQKPSESA
jgi:drug/metabolite transporter (DMT)-like permease